MISLVIGQISLLSAFKNSLTKNLAFSKVITWLEIKFYIVGSSKPVNSYISYTEIFFLSKNVIYFY